MLKIWSPQDDEMLRTLLAGGMSSLRVAARLKRGLGATKARANALGISFKKIKLGLKAKVK